MRGFRFLPELKGRDWNNLLGETARMSPSVLGDFETFFFCVLYENSLFEVLDSEHLTPRWLHFLHQ